MCGVSTIKTDDKKMKKIYFAFLIVSFSFCTLHSKANPCTSITTVVCGTPIVFGPVSGLGDPNYGATVVCGGTISQGGLESIYKFIVPSSGTYRFNVTAASNSFSVAYGYKNAINCNNTGWNCLGVMNGVGEIGAINLNAGDSIFILVNAQYTTSTTSQTFEINCAIPFACNSITTVVSETPIVFGPASGLGDPNYGATVVCGGTITQGGLESIYKFIAPSSGTYQFNVTVVSNLNGVAYGYKNAINCNNTGWNCLGVMNGVGEIGTINLNAGDSIFILANSKTTNITSQTFEINFDVTGIIYNLKQPHLFTISPNPFSGQTTIHSDKYLENTSLTVYNSFGQIVKQIANLSGYTIIFQRNNLPSGLYYIIATQDNVTF